MTDKEFNICVDDYSDGVYRFIVKNIRNKEDARDIVQTAFEKLWINREKVEMLKAKSYLFTVAYHQMIDQIRKEKNVVMTDTFDENANASSQGNQELKQILLHAINNLNPTQKCLILLKDYEGYSYQEIGEIMQLSESQVKVYLHRARLILKNRLTQLEKISA
ncbi:MAG: RNA polymerase sigma factor [Bacteroidetes bacterium]|jgi:RNA polymerase sigma-70 factor (ECF subfamily)|nr:RNA polymerase sigma factor [Bacteroidota bacterium]